MPLAVNVVHKNDAHRLACTPVLRLVINRLQFVRRLIKHLLRVQQVKHLWNDVPGARVIARQHLVEIDERRLLLERDQRVVHPMVHLQSFFVLGWVDQRQVVALRPLATLYLAVLEIANDVLVQVLELQTTRHLVKANAQLLLVAIVDRLNQEVPPAALLVADEADLDQVVRVRHLGPLAAFGAVDHAAT